MARRVKRGPRPRCSSCGRVVKTYRTWTDGFRPFEVLPVDPARVLVPNAFPLYGGRIWQLEDLVDELAVRAGQSRDEARDEAFALPWYVAHSCHHTPPTDTGTESGAP